VLGVGRAWDEAKNLGALRRVGPQLEWPVVVAGGDVGEAALRELFRRAAIFAEPARYEPFGLAALEAALAGCALVLGELASLREVWSDAAVFVDPFDDGSLTAALECLIQDEALRERMAAAARTRAGDYTPERMAVAYDRLYTRLAARKEVLV
jgi:glycogen synthase